MSSGDRMRHLLAGSRSFRPDRSWEPHYLCWRYRQFRGAQGWTAPHLPILSRVPQREITPKRTNLYTDQANQGVFRLLKHRGLLVTIHTRMDIILDRLRHIGLLKNTAEFRLRFFMLFLDSVTVNYIL